MSKVLTPAVVIVLVAVSLTHSFAGPMPVGIIASGSGDLILSKHHGMAVGSITKFKQHKDNPTQSRPPKSQ